MTSFSFLVRTLIRTVTLACVCIYVYVCACVSSLGYGVVYGVSIAHTTTLRRGFSLAGTSPCPRHRHDARLPVQRGKPGQDRARVGSR